MMRLVWPILCAVTLVGLAGVTLWFVLSDKSYGPTGLMREINNPRALVVGNSMAPTLWGLHYEATCQDCGSLNRYASESYPASLYHCFNCKRVLHISDETLRSGAEVVLYQQQKPKRWDMVLVREPSEPERVVKRLIAFPGERIRIQQGDIWIGEERIERTFDDLMNCRLLLYSDSSGSALQAGVKVPSIGWNILPSDSNVPDAALERLVYRHAEPWKSAESKRRSSSAALGLEQLGFSSMSDSNVSAALNDVVSSEVTDWYACDPAYAGPLWKVDDLLVDLRFEIEAPGELAIHYRCANDSEFSSCDAWKVRWDRQSLYWNQRRIELPADSLNDVQVQAIAAYCDGAYWVRLAVMQKSTSGQSMKCLSSYEWHESVDSISKVNRKVLPGEMGRWLLEFKGVESWGTRDVYRDLYFRADDLAELRGEGLERELTGFFLLGDNQLISLDSRQKKEWLFGVPESWLEGTVGGAESIAR